MKMKYVSAAAAAVTAISCTALCAFAESADTSAQTSTETSTVESAQTTSETSVASTDTSLDTASGAATEAADPMDGKNNPTTGVEGVAAVMGVIVVAGAALVISHKHDN